MNDKLLITNGGMPTAVFIFAKFSFNLGVPRRRTTIND